MGSSIRGETNAKFTKTRKTSSVRRHETFFSEDAYFSVLPRILLFRAFVLCIMSKVVMLQKYFRRLTILIPPPSAPPRVYPSRGLASLRGTRAVGERGRN